MSDKLKALIEKARHVRMTPQELQEQEISFAYGNVHYENHRVTRDQVIYSLPSQGLGRESRGSSSF
jgi:hypothetical protein